MSPENSATCSLTLESAWLLGINVLNVQISLIHEGPGIWHKGQHAVCTYRVQTGPVIGSLQGSPATLITDRQTTKRLVKLTPLQSTSMTSKRAQPLDLVLQKRYRLRSCPRPKQACSTPKLSVCPSGVFPSENPWIQVVNAKKLEIWQSSCHCTLCMALNPTFSSDDTVQALKLWNFQQNFTSSNFAFSHPILWAPEQRKMKSMADYKLPLPCHRRAKPRQSGRDTQSVPANRALVLCTSHFFTAGESQRNLRTRNCWFQATTRFVWK